MNPDPSHAHVEARLREELGRLAREPVPALSERVLAHLPARRGRPRGALFALSLAAAALLLGVAQIWIGRAGDAALQEHARAEVAPSAGVQAWVALGAQLAAEEPLRDEARRLASDTRRAAASLWDRLPLTSFLARESR